MKTIYANTRWYSPKTHLPNTYSDVLFIRTPESIKKVKVRRSVQSGFYGTIDSKTKGFHCNDGTVILVEDVLAWSFAKDILGVITPETTGALFSTPDGKIKVISDD